MYSFNEVFPIIKKSLNKECCRKRIGDGFSLIIEFGEKGYHNKINRADSYVGEWSFGIYNRSWRIIQNNQIILGGESRYENHVAADSVLQGVPFGRLVEVLFRNNSDLILRLDNNISIEFLTCCHNEESYNIFLPQKEVLVFDTSAGWVYGKSNKPWPNYINIGNQYL